MTNQELAYIRKIHDKLEAIRDADEAEAFYKKHWPTFQYDRNGKWEGGTRNENGWTP